jgi:hypothetical protein
MDTGGRSWQPRAPRPAREAGAAVLQAHRPDRSGRQRLEASGRERTPRLVKWAVHATHNAKEHQTADTLYGRWRTEAAERGHDPDSMVRQVTGRSLDWYLAGNARSLTATAGETSEAEA